MRISHVELILLTSLQSQKMRQESTQWQWHYGKLVNTSKFNDTLEADTGIFRKVNQQVSLNFESNYDNFLFYFSCFPLYWKYRICLPSSILFIPKLKYSKVFVKGTILTLRLRFLFRDTIFPGIHLLQANNIFLNQDNLGQI